MDLDNFTLYSLELNETSIASKTLGAMFGSDYSFINTTMYDNNELHLYLRITCLIFLLLIFTVGVVGNVMVTMIIAFAKDMRTSTNIFLVNLSIADLLVLVVCTPTALIEVTRHPDIWFLGENLCFGIPLLESTVANASVLTILAISFERYQGICRPLRAIWQCTKSRAVCICLAAWVAASFITSPMIFMITYKEGVNEHQEWTARCDVSAGTFWSDTYTISTIILFFLLPFFILLLIYGLIANRLNMDAPRSSLSVKNENHKNRKQVVTMLGTVVFTFFLCFLPFRVLTLFVILADNDFLNSVLSNNRDLYYNFVYFSRIMVYLNSCLNPILYNVMSSKFRNGFLRLCYRHKKQNHFVRHGTFLTNTTNTASTTMSINLSHQSGLTIPTSGKLSGPNSPELNGSILRKNGVNRVDGKTLKNLLQSHSNNSMSGNGFLISSHRTQGTLYNGIGNTSNHTYYPYHEAPRTSSLRNSSHANLQKNNFDSSSNSSAKQSNNNYSSSNPFAGTMSIKSDATYSAYIPQVRGGSSETVL